MIQTEHKKIIIICIDRDADILQKVGEKGPIVGREKVMDVAVRLGLADPTDTDTNTLFESLKLYDNFKKEGRDVEIITLVGSPDVGVTSDMEISRQLTKVLGKWKADGAIVVTDGAEDEFILPIIQSRLDIISLSRVIVRQSEKLESTYYMIKEFLKDMVNDPKLSRLIIGLPGIAAVLYVLFPQYGWRLIVGVLGVFLVIKGFALEDPIQKGIDEFKSSFIAGKISFFTYAVSALLGIVGVWQGYNEVLNIGDGYINLLDATPHFIAGSIDLLTYAAIVALIGKSIDAISEGQSVWKYISLTVFTVAMWLILGAVSQFLLGQIDYVKFAVYVVVGLILSILLYVSIKFIGGSTKLTSSE
jgi:putative membrane protein